MREADLIEHTRARTHNDDYGDYDDDDNNNNNNNNNK